MEKKLVNQYIPSGVVATKCGSIVFFSKHFCISSFAPSVNVVCNYKMVTGCSRYSTMNGKRNSRVKSPIGKEFASDFLKIVELIREVFEAVDRNGPVACIAYSVWGKKVVEILRDSKLISSYTSGKVRLASGKITDSLYLNLKVFNEETLKVSTPLATCIQVAKAHSSTWRYVDAGSLPSHFFIMLTISGEILSGDEARRRCALPDVELVGVILLEEIPQKFKDPASKKSLKVGGRSKSIPKVFAKANSSKKGS